MDEEEILVLELVEENNAHFEDANNGIDELVEEFLRSIADEIEKVRVFFEDGDEADGDVTEIEVVEEVNGQPIAHEYGEDDQNLFHKARELLSREPSSEAFKLLLELCLRSNGEGGFSAYGGEVLHHYIYEHLQSWPAEMLELPWGMNAVLSYENPVGILEWVKSINASSFEVRSDELKRMLRFAVNVECLSLLGCVNVIEVDLSRFTNLKKLELDHCEGLERLYGVIGMETLEEFSMSFCNSSADFSEALASWRNLRKLRLDYSLVGDFSVFNRLNGLEELYLCDCQEMMNIDEVAGATNLRKLWLEGCSMKNVDGLANLRKLEKLSIKGSANLRDLDGLMGIFSLKSVSVVECPELEDVIGLAGALNLEELSLRGAQSLENLAGLACLTKLKELDLEGCTSLTNVDELDGSIGLRSLSLRGCCGLQNVDGLRHLIDLRCLLMNDCSAFSGINGLEFLMKRFEVLNVEGCTALTEYQIYTLMYWLEGDEAV